MSDTYRIEWSIGGDTFAVEAPSAEGAAGLFERLEDDPDTAPAGGGDDLDVMVDKLSRKVQRELERHVGRSYV